MMFYTNLLYSVLHREPFLVDGLRSVFMKYACKINKKSTTIGCFYEIFCAKAKLYIKKV